MNNKILKLLKSIIFYPMLWLRGVLLGICKIISGVFLLGFIVSLFYGKSAPLSMKIILGVLSFIFFILSFWYDTLLLKLNPTDIELTLFQ